MIGRFTPLALFAALACTPNAALDLPEPSGDLAMIVFRSGDGPTVGYATDAVEVGRLRLLRSDGDRWVLLYLPETLDELSVPPNEAIFDASPEGRPLPLARVAYEARGDLWEPIAGVPEDLLGFRIPGVSAYDCVNSGRCYGILPGDYACIDCGSPTEPTEPTLADLPLMDPCLPGWTFEASSSSVAPSTCDTTPVGCGPDAYATPSAPACSAFDPCPVGLWPSPLPAGPTLRYVGPDPGGVALDRVHSDLATALAAAAPGDRLLLARGIHALAQLDKAVTIEGTCVDGTTIGPGPLQVSAAASLVHLSLTAAVTIDSPGALDLDDARVSASGWSVGSGGRLSIIRSKVSAAGPGLEVAGAGTIAGVGWIGIGPRVVAGGQLDVEDAAFFGAPGVQGIAVAAGARGAVAGAVLEAYDRAFEVAGTIDLDTVTVRNARIGIAGRDATVTATRLVLVATSSVGILVTGGRLVLRDVIIDLSHRAEGLGDAPLRASSDATRCRPDHLELDVERLLLRSNRTGPMVVDCGTSVINDLTIFDSRHGGVRIGSGSLTARRWTLDRIAQEGVRFGVLDEHELESAPGTVAIEDLDIRETGGEGLKVGQEVSLMATRVCVTDAEPHGVAIRGRAVSARFFELEIDNIDQVGPEGACLHLAGDRSAPPLDVEIRIFEIERCPIGVDARPAAKLKLFDGHFRGINQAFSLRTNEIDPRDLLHGVRLYDTGRTGLE